MTESWKIIFIGDVQSYDMIIYIYITMGMHLTQLRCQLVNFYCYVNIFGDGGMAVWDIPQLLKLEKKMSLSVVVSAGKIWCPSVPFERRRCGVVFVFFLQAFFEMIQFFQKSCVIHDKIYIYYITYKHIYFNDSEI